MDTLMKVLDAINGVIWHDMVLYVVLAVGVLFTIWSGFSQFRALTHGSAVIRGKYDDKNDPGAINHFQALSAALSATVGLGNIAGVAVAVALGGPGAVFWMWVVGILGMAIKTTEVTLSMLYRDTSDPDRPHGGPMFVAKKAFAAKGLGAVGTTIGGIFVVTLLISTITGGNMFQSWAVGQITQNYFGVPSIACGIILAVVVGLVIIGGIKRIGAVAGRIVPLMCGIYVLAALVVIVMNIQAVPAMLILIVTEAFSPSSAEGAFLGGTAGYALLWGMKRALFSSEAGQGSSPIAHSAAKTDEPVREGIVAGLEPFIDTIVVCTLTALVILTTGVWNRGPEAVFADSDNVGIVFVSAPAADLNTAPSVTVAGSVISVDLITVMPTRIPTADEEEAVAEGRSRSLPEWRRGDRVFVFVTSEGNDEDRISIGGRVVRADGQLQVRFAPLEFAPEDFPAWLTNPIADVRLYHGGSAAWSVESPKAVPAKNATASRISGNWRDADQLFVIVEGDFNRNTGLNLHRLGGTLKLTDVEDRQELHIEWGSISALERPRLKGTGRDLLVEYPGASLTGHAFDTAIPGLGKYLVTLAAWLFAVSTMISWSYYGENGIVYLFGKGEGPVLIYKLVYCVAIVVAAAGFIKTDAELDSLTALGTGVMLWANIPIMLIFGAIAMKAYKDYISRLKSGELDQTAHTPASITDVIEGKDVE